jgi:hypothetical protein
MLQDIKIFFQRLWGSIWTSLVFWVGDIRSLGKFPWVTWAIRHHEVDFREIHEARLIAKPGDVGVHRDNGYLSNVAIPGFMKHAWIHVEDGKVVEAISEGVVKRDMYYPLYSDFSVILRPRSPHSTGAVAKAESIVGENYDVDFSFDIEKEMAYYSSEWERESSAQKGYDPAFSCTEVVAFSWWHSKGELQLKRRMRRGRNVILADDFFSGGFDIVWASESVTVESAQELGLPPTGIRMIAEYWNNNSQ